jgi:galactonate dehydratase
MGGKGFSVLKFDPFGAGGLEISRPESRLATSLVEAVRDALGPEVEIFNEAHGRMDPSTAIAMARGLERFDPAWYEGPVLPEDIESLLFVKSHIGIPVVTGGRCQIRYGFRDLVEPRAAGAKRAFRTVARTGVRHRTRRGNHPRAPTAQGFL